MVYKDQRKNGWINVKASLKFNVARFNRLPFHTSASPLFIRLIGWKGIIYVFSTT